ncbi:MAG: elongation factor Ts [Candidatus Paceibacterota bacterium]
MADITTENIKELRERTQVSVMKCKEALTEADGDMDKAIKILEEKSEATAAKKSSRDLGAGVVSSYVHSNNTVAALVELQCETDFVARNEEFQKLAYEIAMHVAAMNPQYVSRKDVPEDEVAAQEEKFGEEFADKPDDIRENAVAGKLDSYFSKFVLLEQAYIKDDEKSISDLLHEATQTFGENVAIGEISRIETIS